MKQHEAVIQTIEELGGVATLGQLYSKVLDVPGSNWATKTPLASIRRIVQTRKEIYKIKPGLYGLMAKKAANETEGIVAETDKNKDSVEVTGFDHSYYQGLLLSVAKLKGIKAWAPNQDKNRKWLGQTI